MLKVYGRANSINVRKVLWMLDEVGVEYEREDWGRGFKSTDDPVFRTINPVGVVPVIDDGDYRLAVDSARGKVTTQQATIERIGKQIEAQRAAIDQAKAQLPKEAGPLGDAGQEGRQRRFPGP